MLRTVYNGIIHAFTVIGYFFYYLVMGNNVEYDTGKQTTTESVNDKYYGNIDTHNTANSFTESELYQPNNNQNIKNGVWRPSQVLQTTTNKSFFVRVWDKIKDIISKAWSYSKLFGQKIFSGLRYLGSIMYAPFKVLLNVLIYILELVFYGVAWVFQKVFGLFRSKGNGNDDNVGLRKKDDDVLVQEITEEYLAEDLNIINSDEKDDNYECALEPHHSDLTSSLHPESTFNSERIQPRIAFDENAIKSEYGDGVHNRPTSTSESGSTPSFDNASFYTQKRNVNPDIINAAYTSTGDNRTNELTHQNLTNPPTPPPPLAESFLKDFYDKQHPSTLIENELTDSQLYSRPTSSCSYTNNYASDAFLPPLTPYSTSPTKNMICKATKKAAEGDWTGTSKNVITLMNDNKNDDNNNDEMHYVFNHLRTNKNNISQTVPFNPVSADFFIGNSVFQPVREVETMRNAFNRKTEEKWRETTSSPSFNNRGYQELSGNCFDGVGNNNNSAIDGNKNYYVTTPSERATPIYALDGPDTSPYNHGRTSRSLSQNPSYLAQPTNWRYNNTTKPFVNTNFHPEVVSCKRTFERRVISRSYNQDSEGRLNKDWEVESFSGMQEEFPQPAPPKPFKRATTRCLFNRQQ